MFSFGGGAGGGSTYQHQESDVSNIEVKFDYLRVRIERPWLVQDIFGYKFWTWSKTVGFSYISDGGNLGIDPPQRPIGRMPFLPTHFILVKNVELSANFSHNDSTFIASQISARASAGWGPFSISGSYSESTTEQYTHASFDGTTLKIAQPQIIAFAGTLLPKTPDPDPRLPWQDDAAPPRVRVLEEFDKIRQQDEDELVVQLETEELRSKLIRELDRHIVLARSAARRRINKLRKVGGEQQESEPGTS
jgi:hypothetical protein